MAETLLDVRHEPKARAYELVHAAFDQVMGDTDLTADDFLRVSLSVRDSDGNTSRSFVDLAPANPGTRGGGGGGGDEDAPRSQILFPDDGTPFSPGDEVRFSGTAVDPQDEIQSLQPTIKPAYSPSA